MAKIIDRNANSRANRDLYNGFSIGENLMFDNSEDRFFGAKSSHGGMYIHKDGKIKPSTFSDNEYSGYFKNRSDVKKAIDKYHD